MGGLGPWEGGGPGEGFGGGGVSAGGEGVGVALAYGPYCPIVDPIALSWTLLALRGAYLCFV